MKFNWDLIPTYEIIVSMLEEPYEICRLMKTKKIDKYVYQITWKGLVIKYGMSADNSHNYGERLYRQIGHSKSWGDKRLNCSSGADWRIIEEDFLNLYGFDLDKNNLKIKIWDVTNYPFETINCWDEVYLMEQTLILKYQNIVGSKPIGNIHDDKNVFNKSYITKKIFGDLFDES